MRFLNIEVRKVLPDAQEIAMAFYNKAEGNAYAGLTQANVDLRLHTLLLEQASEQNRTEAEIKGYTEAIERDKKAINNFETQLRAIEYERNQCERCGE